jgi:hypothetical protein
MMSNKSLVSFILIGLLCFCSNSASEQDASLLAKDTAQPLVYYILNDGNIAALSPPAPAPVVVSQPPPPTCPSCSTPSPCQCQQPKPCGKKPCEPEKVRIVVVSDCDDKDSQNSEDNESSEEIAVKPRMNRRLYSRLMKQL